jgi:uncharacterized membrane protein HdeD (DUF308 family)
VSGILIAIVGVIAFISPAIAGLVSVKFFGVLFVVAGVIEVWGAFRHRHERSLLLPFLSGILTAAVGVVFLARPMIGLASVALLLIAYFFVTGLFRGITSLVDRYHNWGWDLAYGVIAVAAAVVLFMNWPLSSLFLVGLLVGVQLIALGVTLMAGGWSIRRAFSAPAYPR